MRERGCIRVEAVPTGGLSMILRRRNLLSRRPLSQCTNLRRRGVGSDAPRSGSRFATLSNNPLAIRTADIPRIAYQLCFILGVSSAISQLARLDAADANHRDRGASALLQLDPQCDVGYRHRARKRFCGCGARSATIQDKWFARLYLIKALVHRQSRGVSGSHRVLSRLRFPMTPPRRSCPWHVFRERWSHRFTISHRLTDMAIGVRSRSATGASGN